MRKKDRFNRL